jgi:hypothetical protein
VSKHEKDDPGRRDGQRPPDKPLPKEPDPGKHGKQDKK